VSSELTYFASDGSYGDAEGISVIDTSDWTETDWSHVTVESDHNRVFIARMIAFTKELDRRNAKK